MGGQQHCKTTMKMGEGGTVPVDCTDRPTTGALYGGSVMTVAAAASVRQTADKCTTASSGCSENVSGDACAACQQLCAHDDGCYSPETLGVLATRQTALLRASGAVKRHADITDDVSDDITVDCECLATKLERSLSLSPRHSAPVSPRRKKAVRFADALGLDLQTVKHFLDSGDPPFVPESATRGLKLGDVPSRFRRQAESSASDFRSYIMLRFSQPGAAIDFISEVTSTHVKVENCVVNKDQLVVNGTVRVANIAFEKHVAIRYTFDNWVTCSEVRATYVPGSNDGLTDRFAFVLLLQPHFGSVAGSRAEFAVRYDTPGHSQWDNNHGRNYVIECYVPSFYVGPKPPPS